MKSPSPNKEKKCQKYNSKEYKLKVQTKISKYIKKQGARIIRSNKLYN